MVDRVEIRTPDAGAPEGHEEAMIAKIDKANEPPPTDAPLTETQSEDRPQWLPEKFKSPEDLAKAYAELETKLGGQKAPAQEADPAAKPEDQKADEKAPEKSPEEKAVDDALKAQNLNLEDFSKEFQEKGELTPESYEKLTKAGFPKALVDQYIEGQKALAANYQQSIFNEAGGEEQYKAMTAWAKTALSPADIDAYNTAINSGSAQAKLAVAGLLAKYTGANGKPPAQLLKGDTGKANVESDVYASRAEMTKDMKDPRYHNDAAYRAKVIAKIDRSNII